MLLHRCVRMTMFVIFFTTEVKAMINRRILRGFAAAVVVLLLVSYAVGADKDGDDGERRMEILGLGFDRITQSPVVLLTDKEKETVLPIWIGLCEARSIEIGRSGLIPPRPLTYDMIAAVIRTLNGEIKKIVVSDLRDQVFYAQVVISVNGKLSKIDARPSDAIALASRMESPIFVKDSVIEKASLLESDVERRGL